MAASDFRLDIDLGKDLGITGGGGGAAASPGAGIFSFPSILNIADFAFKGITAAASYNIQDAKIGIANAEAQTRYWTEYGQKSAENYRNYEYQLDSWYRQSDYVEKRRQYERDLQKQRAIYKGEVADFATKDFEKKLADLEGRFYEEEAKETIELDNIRTQLIGRASKIAASGQVGRSTVGMKTAFNQQWLANVSNRQITRQFRLADKVRAGEALNAARESTINQVQFYTPQPVADPIKPLAPLPIQGVEPTPAARIPGSSLAVPMLELGLTAYQNYKAMQPPEPKPSDQQSFYGKYKFPGS